MEELCAWARVDLAGFGALADPLLVALDVVRATAGSRSPQILAEPSFVLELVERPWPEGHRPSSVVMGRLLDHLRVRAGISAVTAAYLSVADAVADYEARSLALCAPGTQQAYRTWVRRLVAAHGDNDVTVLTAVDLGELIAHHRRGPGRAHTGVQHGRCAEETAVSAFRHFWNYLVHVGAVPRNVAQALRKPLRPTPLRRPIRPDEAALVRQFARMGWDPLLNETVICLVERLGLRPVELLRLRLCDVDLDHAEVAVTGKGDRQRLLPLPPGLTALLERYVEDRRPAGVRPGAWRSTAQSLVRRRPDTPWSGGPVLSRRGLDNFAARVTRVVARPVGGQKPSLYSYRHALASWIDPRYGRPMTRRVLGHTSRFTVTDHYVHVDEDQVREALCA